MFIPRPDSAVTRYQAALEHGATSDEWLAIALDLDDRARFVGTTSLHGCECGTFAEDARTRAGGFRVLAARP